MILGDRSQTLPGYSRDKMGINELAFHIKKFRNVFGRLNPRERVGRINMIRNIAQGFLDKKQWVSSSLLRSVGMYLLVSVKGCEEAMLYDSAVVAFDMLVALFKYKVDDLMEIYEYVSEKYGEEAALSTIIVLYRKESAKNLRKAGTVQHIRLSEEALSRLTYYSVPKDYDPKTNTMDMSKPYRVYNRVKPAKGKRSLKMGSNKNFVIWDNSEDKPVVNDSGSDLVFSSLEAVKQGILIIKTKYGHNEDRYSYRLKTSRPEIG